MSLVPRTVWPGNEAWELGLCCLGMSLVPRTVWPGNEAWELGLRCLGMRLWKRIASNSLEYSPDVSGMGKPGSMHEHCRSGFRSLSPRPHSPRWGMEPGNEAKGATGRLSSPSYPRRTSSLPTSTTRCSRTDPSSTCVPAAPGTTLAWNRDTGWPETNTIRIPDRSTMAGKIKETGTRDGKTTAGELSPTG